MIDELKKNIDFEMGLLREISTNMQKLENSKDSEKRMIEAMVLSLRNKMVLVNNGLPEIIKNLVPAQPLAQSSSQRTNIETVRINDKGKSVEFMLNKKDKEKFLKEHSVTSDIIKRLQKAKPQEVQNKEEFAKARGYVKISNKFFLETAQKITSKGNLEELALSLRKANMDVLFSSYVAMIIFSTCIAVGVGLIMTLFLLFFNLSFVFPFISSYTGNILSRFIIVMWLPLVAPVATALAMYYYPSTEKDTIEKKIDQELPFAVIHMSAISGSGIEPSEIFRIIGLSNEYPYLKKEIRKVMNQINLYGYDLVTGLNYIAKNTPSSKLSELLAGLSTTISSGGDLSEFFEKRAETLLMGYRLEREKFTHVAETFMDIYISVVIAAPMILMLLLIMIQVSNFQIGFTTTELSILITVAIAILNMFFIAFLHMKAPAY
jgi:pilus assembly protein TadC